MLWSISVIFMSLWLIGIGTPSTLHGYLHTLLAVALITPLIPILWRKKQPPE